MSYNISDRFPELFEQRNGELFFVDELKFIYTEPLRVIESSLGVDVKPLHNTAKYVFRLGVYNEDGYDDNDHMFYCSNDIPLSDDACMRFYNYNIFIAGYDKDVIMRRWTINNIIK